MCLPSVLLSVGKVPPRIRNEMAKRPKYALISCTARGRTLVENDRESLSALDIKCSRSFLKNWKVENHIKYFYLILMIPVSYEYRICKWQKSSCSTHCTCPRNGPR